MRRHVSHFHSNQHPSATDPGRRGSVLLIVISLLGLLMLLGFVFFTFASQEQVNARSFAAAAKGSPSDINYFRLAMEQLLVGSRADEPMSALYMGRHSILGNMYGKFRVPRTAQDLPLRRPGDLQPFNGQGITLTMETTPGAGLGAPRVAGGSGPPAAWTWQPSLGIAKNTTALRPDMHNDFGGTNPSGTIELPAPDVGYTAPDVNTLFLGYQGPALAVDGAGVITNAPREAVIPSFHLPQLLRNLVTGLPLTTWATDSVRLGKTEAESTATRVLRPHPDHEFVFFDYTTLQPIATKVPRFLHATLDAGLLPSSGAFPFIVDDDNAGLPDGNPNEQGLFSQSGVLPLSAAADAYEFDVDNTGTGEREGIWLDLDLPVEETTGGVLVVPLVSFTVRDADGLINLSVHGNLSGERSLTNLDSGIPERDNFGKWLGPDGVPGQVGDDDGNSVSDDESEVGWPLSDDMLFISQSNHGLGPSEVNPLYALNRDPTDPSITPQDLAHLNRFFGKDPQDAFEAANMEWFLLNVTTSRYHRPALRP